jgi:hypothetical protein
MTNCKSCNSIINENYCPNCGQPATIKRIDAHYIQHEIQHVLHVEKGILYTIKELLIRPGQTVKQFISEDRNRLVKPIIFIIVSSLIYTLIVHFFHIEDHYVSFEETKNKETAITMIFKWVQNNYGYSNIIMGAFIALWLKLFFKKQGYNIFELLILLCFVMGIGMLIYAVFAIIEGLARISIMDIAAAIGLVYCTWAIGQFFDKKRPMSYFKSLISYLLGLITFGISIAMVGGLIDLIMKH